MEIREAIPEDFEGIWPIFKEVVEAGETYGYALETSKEEAYHLWMELPRKTYVVSEGGRILGTYYIKNNQNGPGSHVCNCGYMVSSASRGQGIATLMCKHSQQQALDFGYKAMQFNFVAASNEKAVKLWQSLGFETVGRLPQAFHHPHKGYVDALVMYKWLGDQNSEG
ncbi:GNAT family N-acetyltransferase [Hahella sp. CCB-MM4]|uniref:GNAT family N-acetyltransferase n=1 Tax=Hahella sp. (strain CCB-MM4) TaxID=1926491 RepID=UPI000B9C0DE6|nr:N-acetyltransferase [Hahella sp. CCB-MM4]OZG72381.1 GNAT family N-acetyltransferase [Hahella sp. CCB-MM4]